MGSQFRGTLCFLFLLSLQCATGNAVALTSGVQEETDKRFLFPCDIKTNRNSERGSISAHSLNPSDIKVLSALRSLKLNSGKASNKAPFQSLEETLLKASQFTELYVGQKLQSSVSRMSPAPQENLEDEAKKLVADLKQSLVASLADDWKMILIFVTAEDPCGFCDQYVGDISRVQWDKTPASEDHTESTITRLTGVLDYLQQQMPKTFVSLVDLTELTGMFMSHPGQSEIRKSCDCFGKPSDYTKTMFRFTFQEALERLISSGRYDTREDFTVVLHPVLKMMEPVNQPRNLNNYGEVYEVQCSRQGSPFLNTHKNSPYTWLSTMLNSEKNDPQPRKIGSNFSCTDLSPSDTVPTSVHSLKPADFKVIAALGDSITAGNGAGAIPINLLDVVSEYRGISWSIGGDEDLSNVTTLANILRKFNPNIEGYSKGIGSHHLNRSYLNRAVPGAKADDMLEQSKRLVQMLKSSSKINMAEDWKLLTIFIGGNDLCAICKDPIYHSPENFVFRLQEALDYLQEQIPRLFVNLVTILDIIPLKQLYNDKRTHCPQAIMRSLCNCVVGYEENSPEIETLKQFNKEYQEKTHQLVESGRYDTKEDFAVVIQPFFEQLEIPTDAEGVPDRSYMAPDCFHFGEKAHAQGARSLWKNMLEPLGQKTNNQKLDEDITIMCPPSGQPFIRTARNSNYVYPTTTPDLVHGSTLGCTDKAPSATKPTSVHALRPADVTVVAAIGDSLTAGNGIGSKPQDVLDVLNQYRGLSWSIGGDDTLERVTTLPNILREFNTYLTGFSTGTGNSLSHSAFLNEAVPGAKAMDLPDQVRALITQMKQDKRINFHNDWKVITVFIGPNDLCASCSDSKFFSAPRYISHIQEALDILHQEVPNTFVNLVEVLDIFPLREATLDPRVDCPVLITKMLCPCLLNIPENSEEMRVFREVNSAYQAMAKIYIMKDEPAPYFRTDNGYSSAPQFVNLLLLLPKYCHVPTFSDDGGFLSQSIEQFIDSGRYDTREDFTVVLQPFFRNPKIPHLPDGTPDVSFLAPDCFHLGQRAHSQMARMLWKNMLQPVGQKTDTLDFLADVPLSCPTQEQPFLRTYKNSNYKYPSQPPTQAPIQNWGSDMRCQVTGPSDQIPTSDNLFDQFLEVTSMEADMTVAGRMAGSQPLLTAQVHKLRPADVKVVGALGDSLTAAWGARAAVITEIAQEWRGISWSIGGDGNLEEITTLPNILKKFNPNLKGFSTGVGKGNTMFNVAIGGSKAENMTSQANTLVTKMKESKDINFNEDWKIITLFIGGNDLCQFCQNRDRYSLNNHVRHVETALDILYKEIPRAFVNLVEIMEVEGLRSVTSESFGCSLLKPNLCPCFINPREGSPELNEVKKFNKDLQEKVGALAEKYQGREDFAVVTQPFFRNSVVPVDDNGHPDVTFFSLDCFHFDERGHAEMAIALWNNMLEPVGQKQNFNNFTHDRTKIKCPSNDHPYLFTLKNSGLPENENPTQPPKGEDPQPDDKGDQVPSWSLIVGTLGGVAVGCAVVGIAMAVTSRKKAGKLMKSDSVTSSF